MDSPKIENLLNLALDSTREEREKSLNLQVGYDEENQEWEVILKYDQEAGARREELAGVVPLSYGYGIVRVPQSGIDRLAALPEVEYMEKPKRLFFAVNRGKAASCFLGLPEVRNLPEAEEGLATAVTGEAEADRETAVTGEAEADRETAEAREAEADRETAVTGEAEADRETAEAREAEANQEADQGETVDGETGERRERAQERELPLDGRGVIVAVIDSGVDYFHSDFRREDGSTRILNLWDQTVSAGKPPLGFLQGTEFSREQINEALQKGSRAEGYRIVPSVDNSGHGTAVLGIAAGNGNASGGRYIGGAPGSELLVVKLGTPGERDFPSTTQLMQALEYVIRKARDYRKPVAVNLSFGNGYGSHSGTSLLETYMNEMAGTWKNVIVVGSGNEGTGTGHTSGILGDGEIEVVELAVSAYETTLNLQLWKNYADEFEITLVHPSGQRITLPSLSVSPIGQSSAGTSRYRLGETQLLVYYGVPSPYSANQEIYLDFLPAGAVGGYVDSGVWRIELTPERVVWGNYDMWLPGGEVLNPGTGFLRPSPEVTLTIPSTAEKVITVGAYDANRMSYAAFSGRGYTRYPEKIKPDLAAPGVNITTAAVGGGYAAVTGTSFATPFVTAAAALLMQWGISAGKDPYLYGEKVKAYLRRGARPLPGFTQFPNNQVGYGALCVRDSLPV